MLLAVPDKSVLNSTVPTPSDDSALIIPLVFIVAFALIIVLSLVLLGILVKLRKHGPQHQSDNESHEQCNGELSLHGIVRNSTSYSYMGVHEQPQVM